MKQIPVKDKFVERLKDKFIERYKKIAPDYDEFIKYSFFFLRKSLRVNTLKISVSECKKRLEKQGWTLKNIPWCKHGFWIEHKTGRRDIGNTIEHTLGYIYVQEAASMIPPIVLNIKPGQKVLDMCAAPGSKTTQIAMYLDGKGVVVANDYKGERLAALGVNVQRCGITNCVMTLMHGKGFKHYKFDRVLVDAPCSGTGTIRKSLKTIDIWNPGMIKRLCKTQKKLIENGFENLKKNGILVYSTCTLEPEECEGVIDYLLSKYDNAKVEEIKLKIKRSEPILEFEGQKYNKEIKKCLRIWPQDNDTEGFFIAKIIKK